LCRRKDAPHFDAGDRFSDWLVKQSADDYFHVSI
jgi:hypothetical protein